MELHSSSKIIETSLELNNKFVKNYPFCNIISHDYVVKGVKKFIGMMEKDGTTLLASEYLFLGSYTKDKNLWVWSDISVTIDKSMKKEIQAIRSEMLDFIANNSKAKNKDSNKDPSKIRSFIENDYSVLPTLAVANILSNIAGIIFEMKNFIILTNGYRDVVDVIIIKRIVHDGTDLNKM